VLIVTDFALPHQICQSFTGQGGEREGANNPHRPCACPLRGRPLHDCMRFEWDERKRFSNAEKHGLDFLDAELVFRGTHFLYP
jgi:hypothetical protein